MSSKIVIIWLIAVSVVAAIALGISSAGFYRTDQQSTTLEQQKSAPPFVREVISGIDAGDLAPTARNPVNGGRVTLARLVEGDVVFDLDSLQYYEVVDGAYQARSDILVELDVPIYIADQGRFVIPSEYQQTAELQTFTIDVNPELEYDGNNLGLFRPTDAVAEQGMYWQDGAWVARNATTNNTEMLLSETYSLNESISLNVSGSEFEYLIGSCDAHHIQTTVPIALAFGGTATSGSDVTVTLELRDATSGAVVVSTTPATAMVLNTLTNINHDESVAMNSHDGLSLYALVNGTGDLSLNYASVRVLSIPE